MAIKDKPVNKQTGKAQPEDTISHSRRTLLLGGAAIGLAGASVGASAVMAREAGPGAGKNTPPLDQGVVAQCEKMLDLAFDDDERARFWPPLMISSKASGPCAGWLSIMPMPRLWFLIRAFPAANLPPNRAV